MAYAILADAPKCPEYVLHNAKSSDNAPNSSLYDHSLIETTSSRLSPYKSNPASSHAQFTRLPGNLASKVKFAAAPGPKGSVCHE